MRTLAPANLCTLTLTRHATLIPPVSDAVLIRHLAPLYLTIAQSLDTHIATPQGVSTRWLSPIPRPTPLSSTPSLPPLEPNQSLLVVMLSDLPPPFPPAGSARLLTHDETYAVHPTLLSPDLPNLASHAMAPPMILPIILTLTQTHLLLSG